MLRIIRGKLADSLANTYAGVVKLVDTHGLGPCAERPRGSSPLTGTESDSVVAFDAT